VSRVSGLKRGVRMSYPVGILRVGRLRASQWWSNGAERRIARKIRLKVLLVSCALGIASLGGLAAVASPAQAISGPGPIQFHPPATADLSGSCSSFTISGHGVAWAPLIGHYTIVDVYRAGDPSYVHGGWANVTDLGGQATVSSTNDDSYLNGNGNPWTAGDGPGDYYAAIGDPFTYVAYSNPVWCS
jgi:hypothetical protein